MDFLNIFKQVRVTQLSDNIYFTWRPLTRAEYVNLPEVEMYEDNFTAEQKTKAIKAVHLFHKAIIQSGGLAIIHAKCDTSNVNNILSDSIEKESANMDTIDLEQLPNSVFLLMYNTIFDASVVSEAMKKK